MIRNLYPHTSLQALAQRLLYLWRSPENYKLQEGKDGGINQRDQVIVEVPWKMMVHF